jgi:hypothetical protein
MLRRVRLPAVSSGKRPRLPSSEDVQDGERWEVPRRLPQLGLVFVSGKELKYYDTYMENYTIPAPGVWDTNLIIDPTTPVFGPVSAPLMNDLPTGRRSRGILIKNIQFSGNISVPANPTSLIPPEMINVFVCLVLDTQTNGVQCSSLDIWEVLGSQPTSNMFPPFRNMNFSSRFQVLWWDKFRVFDKMPFTIDTVAIPPEWSFGSDVVVFDKYLPLDLVVRFNSGIDGTIASVVDNSIHVFAIQTGGAQSYLFYKSRIRFADLAD